MYRFGIASKIGSIAKMFPTKMSEAVLKRSSNILVHGIEDFFSGKNNVELLEANAALTMKDNLRKLTENSNAENPGKLLYNQYYKAKEGVFANTQSKFVVIEDSVYRKNDKNSYLFESLDDMGALKNNSFTAYILDKNRILKDKTDLKNDTEEIIKNCSVLSNLSLIWAKRDFS